MSEPRYSDVAGSEKDRGQDSSGGTFKTYDYVYDHEGRLTETWQGANRVEWLTYDEPGLGSSKGTLTTAENDTTKVQYTYDNMGRVTRQQTTYKTLGNRTYSVNHSCNTRGQVSAIWYTDDLKGQELYRLSYTYENTTGRLSAILYNHQPIITYTYHTNGTIASEQLGNGYRKQFDYIKDILVARTAVAKGSKPIYDQSFGYDNGGCIVSTNHTDLFAIEPMNTQLSYTYNLRDELTGVQRAGDVINDYLYNYDANGNRKKFENAYERNLQDNLIDAYDRITTRYSTTGKQLYDYDAAGNMTGKHLYNSQTALNSIKDVTYAYNYQDAMTEVRVANQVIASYQYDTNKQRIYSDTHYAGVDETKIYHWDMSGHIIGEETVPSVTTWYIYAGNNKIAMLRASGTSTGSVTEALYYFVNDLQGTPVLITDTSGNIVQKIQLDPYGNVERALGIFPDEINYTGKKLDPVTGLYYFNQRWYDPEIGRFMSNDPAKQGMNPYVYCANNPLMYVDPDGEFWWLIGALIGSFDWQKGQFKDFSKLQTWADMAFGGILGGAVGTGVGWANANLNISMQLGYFQGESMLAGISWSNVAGAGLGISVLGWGLSLISNGYHDNGSGGGEGSGSNPAEAPYRDRSVYAVADGICFQTIWEKADDHAYGSGYGIYTGKSDDYWLYGHMDPNKPHIKLGQYAIKGITKIGSYANPTNGYSDGPHVHIQHTVSGRSVDPGQVSPLRGGRLGTPYGNVDSMHTRPHRGVDWLY